EKLVFNVRMWMNKEILIPSLNEQLKNCTLIQKLDDTAWIIHRISKKQRNPMIHTGLRCFGVSPIGCAYMLRLSR
ncbi:hypothetical protein AADX89_12565, partial [Staphylococcus epidermidis]|uniref:hypothetical protein n=1 Tax=Staphylococcus epidermidis TaxID=1282 RepID=UPI00311DCE50